jgi:hypothetical protein
VIGHFRELERYSECPDHLDVFLDLSGQTSIPMKENLQEVAIEIERVRAGVQFDVCAIVARTDALFGMIRMFEVFVERYFRESCVFRTRREAKAWLAARRAKALASSQEVRS